MKNKKKGRKDGMSLAKGPVAIVGIALLAYGILNFIFGGNGFSASPIDGTVNGDTFLGIEANGWTNVLFVGAGLLLLLGSPFHWGAKTTAIVVGLVLGAASVISMVDGSDVFGIFATNGLTQLVLGAAATLLLILALLPRIGKKDKGRDHDHDHDRDRHRDRDHDRDRHREREVVYVERDRDERLHDDRDEHRRGDREIVGRDERDERFDRERGGRDHDRVVVAPADGDGVEDRNRESYDRRDR